MKTPGRAWLLFHLEPIAATNPSGKTPELHTLLTQTAVFEPKGLAGFLYWKALYIPHRFIFSGMLRAIAQRAAPAPR